MNARVEATLLTPVYAFDRIVIPAGATVVGHVSALQPVSRWERTRAILNGDFTALHGAAVDFTTLGVSGQSEMPLHAVPSSGLNTLVHVIVSTQAATSSQSGGSGIMASGKHMVRDQVSTGVARVKSIPSTVRLTNKREWLYDFLMSKLPYHPQYVRSRTRFDAELTQPLDFGSVSLPQSSMKLLGTQPATDSVVHARLLTPLNSKVATQGEKVDAVLEEPLLSGDRSLVLPEGTQVQGVVVLAKPAGWFHHGGRLRFRFQGITLPPEVAQMQSPSAGHEASEPRERSLQLRTQGLLAGAESGRSPLKVDQEGEVQAKDSKTRFIGTAIAALVARSAADNDPIHSSNGAVTGTSSNIGGRTLGGGMGFGLLGAAASQASRNVGTAFGYYGLAWSVFSTVIARGSEVRFDRNAVVDIGFGSLPSLAKTK